MLRCLALSVFFSMLSFPLSANEFTLSFGGDLGLNASGYNGGAEHGIKGGTRYNVESLVQFLVPLWNADLNFANLETVVSDQKLQSVGKKFTFLTPPQALQKLIDKNLNLFSTANNHSYDYGADGARETIRYMNELCQGAACYHSGLGMNIDEALSVLLIEKNGYRIAFASIGILSENNTQHRAAEQKAGTASYRALNSFTRSGPDYDFLLAKMKAVQADLKILSIHFGTEGKVDLDAGQREDFVKAIREGDVDVVLGHHAHVVRPWEIIRHEDRDRVIFYGLGNYLHLGTSNITSNGPHKDYGLYGKLFFSYSSQSKRLEPQVLELRPLTQTHLSARPMSADQAAQRMNLLNALGKKHFGERTATVQMRGSVGLNCWGKNKGPQASLLCE